MKTFKDIFLYAFAALVALGEISLLIFLLAIWKGGASTVDQGVVNLIYGLALGYHSGFMLVLGYFFGSSKGSADKNEMLSEQSAQTKTTSISEFTPELK